MQMTPANRAAPLLIATMLVAAPSWAQPAATPAYPSAAPPPATGAQTSSTPSGAGHRAVPHNRHAGATRQPGETMQDLVERRIADLHGKLHITRDQSQQWDQFAGMMRANAKDMDQAFQQRSARLGSMSAVDNMQSFAQIEGQRAQDMQKLVPAFQTLYASLSDQQKKTADQLFRDYAATAQARRRTSTTQ